VWRWLVFLGPVALCGAAAVIGTAPWPAARHGSGESAAAQAPARGRGDGAILLVALGVPYAIGFTFLVAAFCGMS